MTREEAIKHLKLMQSGARNAIRFKKNDKKISEDERKEDIEIYQDQLVALIMATKALEQESIIEKIRIEISDYEEEVFHRPNTDYSDYAVVRHCLEIIDKYKEESEE